MQAFHRRRTLPTVRKSDGFTLIEMLVVMGIVIIMVTAGVPALQQMVSRNRMTAQLNEFVGVIHTARSEAIKNNTTVSVCRAHASTANTCDTSGSWANGWYVFLNLDDDTAIDAGEEIVVSGTPSDGFTFKSALATKDMTFRPSGRATEMNAPTTGITGDLTFCQGARVAGEITLDLTGRPQAQKFTSDTDIAAAGCP